MKKAPILMIFAMLLSMYACNGHISEASDGYVSVYRLLSPDAQNNGQLLAVEEIHVADVTNPIHNALDLLQEEPKPSNMQCAIPSTVRITKYTVTDRTATVCFNSAYKNLIGIDKTTTIYATVLTLTETGLVDTVSICCDDEILESNLTSADVLPENTVISNDTTKLRLFFPDRDSQYLRAEYHEVSVADGDSIERSVLDELLAGPESPQLHSLLPINLLLLSVSTQKGVCIVSFSAEFLANDSLSAETSTLNIYSIVNSLAAIENIDSVQILVDGKKVQTIGGITTASPLLPRSDLSASMLLHLKQ